MTQQQHPQAFEDPRTWFRWLLGCGLWLAAAAVAAASEPVSAPTSTRLSLAWAGLQQSILPEPFLRERGEGAPGSTTTSVEPLTPRWRYTEPWRQLRGGIGLDIEIADAGNLHFTLLPARDTSVRGMRWQFDTDEGPHARVWSVGASVDVVRTIESDARLRDGEGLRGQRRLVLNPQLVLDLDRLIDADGHAQLTLQHSNWRDASSRRALPDRVWQLSLRWRY